MKDSRLLSLLIGCCIIISSCTTFTPNYTQPTSGPTSSVRITTSLNDYYNMRINVHGKDICSAADSRFVGLLNSRAIGYPNLKELSIVVSAVGEVAISAPQFRVEKFGGIGIGAAPTTFAVCQPVVVFSPKPSAIYEVNFGSCTASVFELKDNFDSTSRYIEPTARMDRSCKVVFENVGNQGSGEDFHLIPR